jgi:putative two-component system hydrogenase maturation factor HypX/HoxX
MRHRLPMTAPEAVSSASTTPACPGPGFAVDVARRAAELAAAPDIAEQLAAKRAKRQSR